MFQAPTSPCSAVRFPQAECELVELDDEQLGVVCGGRIPVGGWGAPEPVAIPVGGW